MRRFSRAFAARTNKVWMYIEKMAQISMAKSSFLFIEMISKLEVTDNTTPQNKDPKEKHVTVQTLDL